MVSWEIQTPVAIYKKQNQILLFQQHSQQVGMDRGELGSERRTGKVKAVAGLFGERITEANSTLKKPQMDNSKRPSSTRRDLHRAKRDIGRFDESRRVAETIKAQAESELSNAKKTVTDLTSKIEESNLKAKAQKHDLERLWKLKKGDEEWALAVGNLENHKYAEVMRELEYVKQELSKLKLDMASVLEERNRAEKEIAASSSKISSYLSSAQALTKEIEEVNEEHVLVELARIEAVKELGAIEAQRKEEAEQFPFTMENTRKKISDVLQEIDCAKETEMKLAVTTSAGNVLQNELVLAKGMDKRVQRKESFRHLEGSFRKGKELESPLTLQSITEELEAAKKELVSIREEGFQFMASMDVIRDELKHISQETARLKKTEEKADATVQNLNSKLLRAKAKLEAVSAAEEKAKTMVSNLSLTLEQLKTVAEAAKKERKLICEETRNIKVEVQKTESEIDSAEERFQAAMLELEAIKSSEAMALENLKTLTENTMRSRASASQHSSTITISKFEYDYLTGRAVGAEEIAHKKVAAAQAWIEALKANEKEILMKTEMTQRKLRELKVEEERETYKAEKSVSAGKVVEGESRNWKEKQEKNSEPEKSRLEGTLPRKSMKENGSLTPARRAKYRKSASPVIRHMTKSGSVTVRRKRKVMPNIAKFFNNKSNETDR
ncbi:protein PLASTID MOVEMENT IMPAIRED 2-like isoform X1 [Camellia sinensis]|uniref:Protein PLASTID MOVEMENT IMPAIRED 2 n=1 Tax=Camellia sinensis var. sinensis TaxID=542762 RepID=A0A4S4ED99_CAMSN|nr:protein PLASTID MOVEMENT IMPAIRED 2-like isoform X1 [Camellia sinensis]THG13706.1 hypothetical protein TEA_022203 [Camellia sinensis var. sinensis]